MKRSTSQCGFRGWRSLGLAAIGLLLGATGLFAHDPPEEYYGRNITVLVEPSAVHVHYRLELSQVSLFSLPRHDDHIRTGDVRGRGALEAACMERFKVLIPDQLVAFLNGNPLNWTFEKPPRVETNPTDSTHFHLLLRAEWHPVAGMNQFEITDGNYPDAPGTYALKFDYAKKIVLGQNIDTPREWTGKGAAELKYRKAALDFRVIGDAVESGAPPAPIEDEPKPPAKRDMWANLFHDDLAALLSTDYGLGLLLLLAWIHGAAHSLMPGHGKTMVAAYLVGERGTPWHAVLLGIVTTITHTIAAIVIALLIRYSLPKNSEKVVNSVLEFSCGLIMIVMGLWLFLQRVAGRSDHVHLFDLGHGHSHGGEPVSIGKSGVVRLVLLGIAGGIIPCWGAITWVIGCIATGQFALALPIVLSFSMGLATVLIIIGLTVVYSGRVGKRRWGERRWFQHVFNERTVRAMPIVGAAVIMAIGLFFAATSGLGAK